MKKLSPSFSKIFNLNVSRINKIDDIDIDFICDHITLSNSSSIFISDASKY